MLPSKMKKKDKPERARNEIEGTCIRKNQKKNEDPNQRRSERAEKENQTNKLTTSKRKAVKRTER